MERSVLLGTIQLVNAIATSSGIRVEYFLGVVSCNVVTIPAISALNKVGFLRRFQFRIMAEAGRFVVQSDEEMKEFSQILEN